MKNSNDAGGSARSTQKNLTGDGLVSSDKLEVVGHTGIFLTLTDLHDIIKQTVEETISYKVDAKNYITRGEACKILGCALPKLDGLRKRGLITSFKPKEGRTVQIDRQSLIDYIESN